MRRVQEEAVAVEAVAAGAVEAGAGAVEVVVATPAPAPVKYVKGMKVLHSGPGAITEQVVEAVWPASYGVAITLVGHAQVQWNESGVAYGKKSLRAARGYIAPHSGPGALAEAVAARADADEAVAKAEAVLHQFTVALEQAQYTVRLAQYAYEEAVTARETK